MKSIKNNISHEITINKSNFICELIKVNDVNQVDNFLKELKIKYKDASHYCYAYIIDDKQKSSDDGEPSGTAGIPILDTLIKNNLNFILCVVIRYFGGIKLGAGGLLRAYKKSVSDCLALSSFYTLIKGYEIILEVPYDKQNDIEYIIKNHFTKDYKENVTYTIECSKEIKEILEKKYYIKSIKEKIIEI